MDVECKFTFYARAITWCFSIRIFIPCDLSIAKNMIFWHIDEDRSRDEAHNANDYQYFLHHCDEFENGRHATPNLKLSIMNSDSNLFKKINDDHYR